MISLHELIPVLQVAIGPVILISGVGLLLLTMTNRLGRTIDRARQLAGELQKPAHQNRDHMLEQVTIIYRRARLLRMSIGLAVFSVLLAALLIVTLFLTALLRWENGLAVSLIFIAGMTSLMLALVFFLLDIHLALVALRLEIKQVRPDLD